jgi:tryptophan synthase alpha chain
MSRLQTRLKSLRAEGRKALAVFLTAGVPEYGATVGLVLELEKAGVDVIEIGLPFSDPLADGPVIQRSSTLAIANGVTLSSVLGMVSEIRGHSEIPIALMGYLNPLLRFGFERFCRAAAGAGVDGVILPEVPLEEHRLFTRILAQHSIDGVLLVTPTSPPSRIRAIDRASSGFLYCVSMTGVTGSHHPRQDGRYLRRVRRNVRKNPVLVGFGIAGPEDARRFAEYADGVIVGSAFLSLLLSGPGPERAVRWIASVKAALGKT